MDERTTDITWYAVVEDDTSRQPVGIYAEVEGDRFHALLPRKSAIGRLAPALPAL